MEVWEDINGYEGFYQISNYGNIKSLTNRNRIHGKMIITKANKILHPTDNGSGYKIISLVKNGERKNKYIHRLVAEAFISNIQGNSYVNHKDYDKSNNHVNNLEWCTQKENVNYSKHKMMREHNYVGVSGEKYISLRNRRYRVIVKRKEYGSFATLTEAIKKRDEVYEKAI